MCGATWCKKTRALHDKLLLPQTSSFSIDDAKFGEFKAIFTSNEVEASSQAKTSKHVVSLFFFSRNDH